MDFSPQQTQERFAKFSSILSSQGLRPALADLLTETDYRFIAIFRFDGDRANAAVFYDRDQPDAPAVDEVPATSTYCLFARETGLPFVTANSMEDARLMKHAARESVQAYCGIPIVTPEGEFLGTLCHYDLVPRDPQQIDLALLCEIVSALEQGGHIPPYPKAN